MTSSATGPPGDPAPSEPAPGDPASGDPAPSEPAPSSPGAGGGVSRRALLTAGLGSAAVLAAGTGIAVWTGSDPDPAPGPGPGPGSRGNTRTVTPMWSELAYRSFGVVSHPTFQNASYGYTEEWLTALDDMGVRYFRGFYAEHSPLVRTTIAGARQRGLQWGMPVCNDLATPPEVLERRIEDIARNAGDLCLFVEGINEPNYDRSGTPVRADWAEQAVALQRTIFEAVRSHPELDGATVIGPSLQAVVATEADYARLADLGLAEVVDTVGLHSYPGGRYPSQGLDERLAPLRSYFPDADVWLTETGYTNAVGSGGNGASPVPEEVAAAYAAPALLEAVDRGMAVVWYELLDDPDPGVRDVAESNFGLLALEGDGAPPWRAKPVVEALTRFLAELRDPGPVHRPAPVTLTVTSPTDDLRWTALGKRDGSTWLHLRRNVDLWDPLSETTVAVDPVPVSVVSPSGRATVDVGAEVTSLRL